MRGQVPVPSGRSPARIIVEGQPGTPQSSSGAAGTLSVGPGAAPGVANTNGNQGAPSISTPPTGNPNTTAQPGTAQPSSGAPLNGIATLNAEKKLGVAEPPSTKKAKDDQMLDQANKSIQRTQRETATTPSGVSAIRK
jgi:hypothetical protein